MAIFFVTGLPRTGKTLWTLCQVKSVAEKDKRQVFTCNIPGVTIPGWLEIDHPDKWMEVPDGSIIIVDELQDFWSKQAPGAKVPLPILELSKHGKRGIDFYFITQEPDLVHTTPRSLCQHHYFVVRAFGSHNAMIYKFERMQLHPEKVKTKGEKFPWRYNKEAFNWYKSADMHNVKRQIPIKVFMIPGALFLAGLAIWLGVSLFAGSVDKAKGGARSAAGPLAAFAPSVGSGGGGGGGLGVGRGDTEKVLTPQEYAASFAPRVEGFSQSAPRYDKVQAVMQAPKPAACIEGMRPGTKVRSCNCWTQQGTPQNVPLDLCKQIVAGGFFDDTVSVEREASGRAPVPVGVAAVSSHFERDGGKVVVSDSHGYGVRDTSYLAARNASTKSVVKDETAKAVQ